MKPQSLTPKNSIIIIAMLLSFIGCEKENEEIVQPIMPKVEIFSLGSNAVTLKSDLVESKSPVVSVGLCLSTSPNPTITNSNIRGYLCDSAMYCRVEHLIPNTQYYAKLYVINTDGTWYGDEFNFTTNATVADIDGNIYNTVTIGSQVWTVENLRTTRFNDGSGISYINTSWEDLQTAGFTYYDFSINNKPVYGLLYNWPTVSSNKLCPEGWHIPSDSEWKVLMENLGGEFIAGAMLKNSEPTTWAFSNPVANNLSGFSALPGGASSAVIGVFTGLGYNGLWWTSTIEYPNGSDLGYNIFWGVSHGSPSVLRNGFMNRAGSINFLSVRCIKD